MPQEETKQGRKTNGGQRRDGKREKEGRGASVIAVRQQINNDQLLVISGKASQPCSAVKVTVTDCRRIFGSWKEKEGLEWWAGAAKAVLDMIMKIYMKKNENEISENREPNLPKRPTRQRKGARARTPCQIHKSRAARARVRKQREGFGGLGPKPEIGGDSGEVSGALRAASPGAPQRARPGRSEAGAWRRRLQCVPVCHASRVVCLRETLMALAPSLLLLSLLTS